MHHTVFGSLFTHLMKQITYNSKCLTTHSSHSKAVKVQSSSRAVYKQKKERKGKNECRPYPILHFHANISKKTFIDAGSMFLGRKMQNDTT